MKKILLLILFVCALSCASDDSTGIAISAENITGTWKPIAVYYEGYYEYVTHIEQCATTADYLEISAENNGFEYYYYNVNCNVSDMELGIWDLYGKRLTVATFDPAATADRIFWIDNLTQTEMTLRYEDQGVLKKVKYQRA